MNAVPFEMSHLYAGLGKCEGILRAEGEDICLEFRIKDSLTGILQTRVKSVRIRLRDLLSVKVVKGWFGSLFGVTIVIQAGRLDVLDGLPGTDQGRLELDVSRKNSDAADRLVSSLYVEDDRGAKM